MATLLDEVERNELRFFTDRDAELDLFDRLISPDQLTRLRILGLHGGAGVGKSQLIDYYKLRCRERKIPYISIDGYGVKDTISIARRIRKDAGWHTASEEFASFDEAINQYSRIQHFVKDDAEFLSGVQKALEVSSEEQILSISSGSQRDAIRGLLNDEFSRKEIDEYLSAETRIPELLIDSLARACTERWLFFVDAYEMLQDRESWLCEELLTRLPDVFRVVLAGRNPYSSRWPTRFKSGFRMLELMPFSSEVTREYLRKRGIHEPALVDLIFELTNGQPLLLGMSADADKPSVYEGERAVLLLKQDIIPILLKTIDPQHEALLDTCAIVRYFDEFTLHDFAGINNAAVEMGQLPRRYSFVKKRGSGLALHDWIWESLNTSQRLENPARFRNQNQLAIEHYTRRIEGLIEGERGEWQKYVVEILFHRLIVDADSGLRFLLSTFGLAESQFRLELCEALILEAANHLKNESWLKLLEARLADSRDDWDQSRIAYQHIMKEEVSSSEAFAFAISGLARVHYRLGQLSDAELLYQQGLRKYRVLGDDLETALILAGLAKVKMGKRKWNSARHFLEASLYHLNRVAVSGAGIDAIGFAAKQAQIETAWTYLNLGVVCFEQGQLSEALRYYRMSLNLFSEFGDVNGSARLLYRIGWVLQQQGQWDDAVEHYLQSRVLFEKLGARYWVARVIVKLAELYRLTGQLARSEHVYLECMRICIRLAAPLGIPVVMDNLGCLYRDQGHFLKAEKMHLKSLDRKKKSDFPFEIELTYLNLGDLYSKMGRYSESKLYYVLSLEEARKARYRLLEAVLLVRLCDLAAVSGDSEIDVERLLRSASNLANRHQFNDVRARVCLLRGNRLLSDFMVNAAVKQYSRAVQYAASYNSYLLDEIANGIFEGVGSRLPESQVIDLRRLVTKYQTSG